MLTLSYSQLDYFEQCNRRYYYKYRLKQKDPAGHEAAFSVHLVHKPLGQMYEQGIDHTPDWSRLWELYKQEIPQADGLALGTIYRLDTARNMYDLYKEKFLASDLQQYEIAGVEQDYAKPLIPGKASFVSKTDVFLRDKTTFRNVVMDFKMSKYDKPEYGLNFHRQLLSQAWVYEADKYIINAFTVDVLKKTGKLKIDFYRYEHAVDLVLLQELVQELAHSANQILACDDAGIYPKRAPQTCFAYGRPCKFLDRCTGGLQAGLQASL